MKFASVILAGILLQLSGLAFADSSTPRLVLPDEPIGRVTVGIYFEQAGSLKPDFCTGVVLSENRILTAGHCVDHMYKKQGVIVFAPHDMRNLGKKNFPNGDHKTVFPINRKYILKGYPGNGNEKYDENRDLGVLEFDGRIPEGYELANFLTEFDVERELEEQDEPLIAAGYSDHDPSSRVSATQVRSPESYSGELTQFELDFWKFRGKKIGMFLRGKNANLLCGGDSGGPVFKKLGDNYFVVGILSIANCFDHGNYTVTSEDLLAKWR